MKNFTNLSPIKNTKPIALYSSEQIYAMEQAWFAQGYDSFGLMQQAAWQMAQQIELLYEQKCLNANHSANTNLKINLSISVILVESQFWDLEIISLSRDFSFLIENFASSSAYA